MLFVMFVAWFIFWYAVFGGVVELALLFAGVQFAAAMVLKGGYEWLRSRLTSR